MAGGRWVKVPGKGVRFLTSSGEFKMRDPTPRPREGRTYELGTTHQGPAYQDPRFLVPNRGRVGGGNAGASTASQWPASLRGPGSVTPIVTGRNPDGTVNRRASDQYRAAMGQQAPAAPAAPQYPVFPLTPQGQFERYFSSGSPEMDRYFGAASRGAGAPGSLEEMNALASLSKAPMPGADGKGPSLATYYRAQSAAGRGNMDTIATALTQGLTGKEAENMAAWARANPMLADRLYNKKFPGGFQSNYEFDPEGSGARTASDQAILSNYAAGTFYPAEGSQMPTALKEIGAPQAFTPGSSGPYQTRVTDEAGYFVPSDEAIRRAVAAGTFYPSESSPMPEVLKNVLRPGANPVPAPPGSQGAVPPMEQTPHFDPATGQYNVWDPTSKGFVGTQGSASSNTGKSASVRAEDFLNSMLSGKALSFPKNRVNW